ncbi:calcium-activated chloride channel regulator 1-like [Discoglossus pictus]
MDINLFARKLALKKHYFEKDKKTMEALGLTNHDMKALKDLTSLLLEDETIGTEAVKIQEYKNQSTFTPEMKKYNNVEVFMSLVTNDLEMMTKKLKCSKSSLSSTEKKALNEIIESNVEIKSAAKGGNIVLMDKVFYATKSSMIKLNDGGYEDIVIAINAAVQEDAQIIERIQDMINEASTYLFHATKQRLFIKSVKIIIPLTWTQNNAYAKLKTETYEKADVIIAKPFWMYQDKPYTLQYGGCGVQGRYIHLTPTFMTDDRLAREYGPRGKMFIHEWAHLRWGVFDEYNNEVPYYIAGNGHIEATRCSLAITGTNEVPRCNGGNCIIDNCNIDTNTNVYEPECKFVPDIDQLASQSIMYSSSIESVTEFCDTNSHNTEAPTLQNRMCNLRSTWEVIMNSTDIQLTPPRTNMTIPAPSYSLLQYRNRVVTLVLDVSGSMAGHDRIGRLYQAADVFLIQVIEKDSYVGIVQFSSSASIITLPRQITTEEDRKHLKNLVPKSTSGATNICSGLWSGLSINKHIDGSTYGTEIILLTDGEDSYDTTLCYSDIESSGAIIHIIVLGPDEAKAVKDIAGMTGGILFLATDKLDTNGLIDAFSGLLSQDGDIFKQAIQLESSAINIRPANCLNGTVYIDSSIGNETFFLVTWLSLEPTISLEDPNGQIYNSAHFVSDTTSRSTRLAIPGRAEVGPWHYSICNTYIYNQVLGITVNSRAFNEEVPPVTVNVHINNDRSQFPSPIVVYAIVSQGHLPVKGAKVTAIIEPVTGNSVTLELLDNGAGADIVKNDGIYSRYFTELTGNGRYNVKVRVEGRENKTRLAMPSSRVSYAPHYLKDGTVNMNPARRAVNDDDPELNLGAFSRTALGASFTVSNVPVAPEEDFYKPEKITDLKAKTEENTIALSWTATGDDLDQGSAARYDLRMSNNPVDLRDNFDIATEIDISNITPQPAGSSEIFMFLPANYAVTNGTILYFALVAFDKVLQKSDISNIVMTGPIIFAASALPTAPPETTAATQTLTTPNLPTNRNSVNLNIGEVTLIVCSAVILISIIISITTCIVSCKKKEKNLDI